MLETVPKALESESATPIDAGDEDRTREHVEVVDDVQEECVTCAEVEAH